MSDLTHKLRSIATAYPEDIFGPVSEAEVKEHASLITRNSAAMGRHLGKFLIEAAERIELLESHMFTRRCTQCGNPYTGSCGEDCEMKPLTFD